MELTQFRGQPTVLLFWSPGCGFCQEMLPDLVVWEAARPADAPLLLVVSSGPVQGNRDMGLAATVLVDDGFAVGQAFGASGTPQAVLIDAEGVIASAVAAGAPAVLALLNGRLSPVPQH